MDSVIGLAGNKAECTVYAAFRSARDQYAGHPFIQVPAGCPGNPVCLTYDQASARVESLAESYRRAGYGRGHHVALLLGSRPEFYLHWLALSAVGATLVAIGADLVINEVRLLLKQGDVDVLVVPDAPTLEKFTADQRPMCPIACLGSWKQSLPPAITPRAGGAAGDATAIVFTSGSTGTPKGCLLSDQYFLSFGRWYRDLGGRCSLRAGCERFITPLPPNHVNALAFSSMGAIMTGGCIVQLDRFRSSQWWKIVRESGATVMHYLGVMPGMLLKLPEDPQDRHHALRFGIGGGVRATDHRPFERRFGVPLLEAWAMTETGGTGTISTHCGPRHLGTACIGRPSSNYSQAMVVDETGKALAPGEVGELVVRAAGSDPRRGFFSGYYRNIEATNAAWTGGWLHTGDLVRQDEEGCFFFVGRRKQIIRRSGENISAAEVEAILSTCTVVQQAAVVPVPDDIREQEVFACVVPIGGLPQTRKAAEQIMRHAAKHLSYFKLPAYIGFVKQLPMTATQKFRYGSIIELAQTMLTEKSTNLFDLSTVKRSYRVS